MITVEPKGGLANRIRAVDSALSMAARFETEARIIWPLLPECNCGFGELFALPGFASLEQKGSDLLSGLLPDNAYFLFKRISGKLRYDKQIFQKQLRKLKEGKFDFNTLKKYRSVYINSYERFYYKDRYKHLFFNEDILARVREISVGFPAGIVGVHIRRTDHKKAIEHNPTEWFMEAISEEIAKDNSVKFFLATDSPQEQSRVVEKFGQRVITFEKTLERDEPAGIKDALVELLCLSRTRKILGSYYSSFSAVAAEIGQIEWFTPAGKGY